MLDHFGIVDRGLRLYIAIGSYHPIEGFVAYLKYVPFGEGPWGKWGTTFSRVTSVYSPYSIGLGGCIEEVYDPFLGASVPIVPRDAAWIVVDPRDVAKRIVSSCGDELECLAAELLSTLVSYGLPLDCIGVSGSMMFGIHVPKHSDIDLVIYGERCIERALEVLPLALEPLPRSRKEIIIENLSHIHGIPLELARKCLEIPRRGLFKGVEVTVVYTWSEPWALRDPVSSSRCVEMEIEVDSGELGALMYPAKFLARARDEELEVWSFEAALSIPMYFGGRFKVRGTLQTLSTGVKRLVLGVRECPSSANYLV